MSTKAIKKSDPLRSVKGRLGMGLKVSPKSAVTIDPEGFSMDFVGSHVTVPIEIGEDVGYLILSENAWNNLKAGKSVKTETVSEVKNSMK